MLALRPGGNAALAGVPMPPHQPGPAAPASPFLARLLDFGGGRRITVGAAVLFALAFLPLPFGSVATVVYFGLAATVLVAALRGRMTLDLGGAGRFAMAAVLAYFVMDAAGLLLYSPRVRAWEPALESLHFLVFPLIVAGLLAMGRADPIRVFVLGARAGAIFSGIIAAIQIADDLDRAPGGMINPLPFGATAALFAFLSLIGTAEEGWQGRGWALLAFAGGLAGTLFSEARGAWLTLPALAVIALVHLGARRGPRIALAASAGLAAVALVMGFVARDSLRERIAETFAMFEGFELGRPDGGGDDARSLDHRALLLKYGLKAFADRPLLGYGHPNAITEVQDRAAAEGDTIPVFGHLHNEFLTEAVGNGLVGLVTLFLVLAAPLVVALRSARDRGRADRVALAAQLTAGSVLFGLTSLAFGLDILNSVFLTGLAVICASASRSARPESAAANRSAQGYGG